MLLIDSKENWEEEARLAFLAGRYRAFLSLLRERSPEEADFSPELNLLAAKALSRIGRPLESIARLAPLTDPKHSGLELAVHAVLHNTAVEVGLGNIDAASASLDRAAKLVASSYNAELEFALQLFRALFAWANRDFAATEALARSAMSSMKPETLAVAGQFLGFVAASRGRYMEQIAILESALAELDVMPQRDVWIEASILQNISGIICDMYLPAVARRMSDRADSIEWPDELTVPRYTILRSLAYFRSLGSDPFLPFDYLDRASSIAPSEPLKLASLLDRVFLVQEMSGDRIVKDYDATEELRCAEEIAARIDWSATSGEDRIVLLTLAELTSKRRPRDAEAYLAQYRGARQAMSPLLMGRSDARWTATENFVEGIVVAANGEKQRGVELIEKAFAFWEDVGHSWRATRAAIKLYELSGEERNIDWAFRESRRYPYSWLSDAVSRAGHRAP
jgi:hypothetical protein